MAFEDTGSGEATVQALGCEQRLALAPASSPRQALIHLLVGTSALLAVDFSHFPQSSSCEAEEESHSVSLAMNEQRDGHIDAGV